MKLEQLKERIEATCNKNGIFPNQVKIIITHENTLYCAVIFKDNENNFSFVMPNAQLTLEAVDLECRAIKARQSSASNGIDE